MIPSSCLQFGMECPRIGKRSTHRSNPGMVSVSDYFRITIFIPFLDSVIQQLKIRFREKTQHVGIFNILQPKKKKGVCTFGVITPQPLRCKSDPTRWYSRWSHSSTIQAVITKWEREFSANSPKHHISALQHCDVDIFPCIHALYLLFPFQQQLQNDLSHTWGCWKLISVIEHLTHAWMA